jgi:hypothetical protein
MSLKLKALGLGLIASMAFGAVAVMNASANGAGHFVTTGNSHAEIKGFAAPGTLHNLHIVNHGLEGEIGCATQSYTATTTTETTTSLTVTPAYSGCTTTSNGQAVPIDVNGCTYTFTVAAGTTNSTEQTIHLICPAGQSLKITHPNCTVSIHPQASSGTTYTKHTTIFSIPIWHQHIEVKTTRHGLCQFIAPTAGASTFKGSMTLKAFNTVGSQISLTAT